MKIGEFGYRRLLFDCIRGIPSKPALEILAYSNKGMDERTEHTPQ